MMKQIIPHLTSRDVSKAIAYFKDTLGFDIAYSQEGKDRAVSFAIIKKDNIEMMLADTETMKDISAGINISGGGLPGIIYIQMDSVADYYDKVKDKAKIIRELSDTPWGTTEFWIEDTDGFIYSFFKQ